MGGAAERRAVADFEQDAGCGPVSDAGHGGQNSWERGTNAPPCVFAHVTVESAL